MYIINCNCVSGSSGLFITRDHGTWRPRVCEYVRAKTNGVHNPAHGARGRRFTWKRRLRLGELDLTRPELVESVQVVVDPVLVVADKLPYLGSQLAWFGLQSRFTVDILCLDLLRADPPLDEFVSLPLFTACDFAVVQKELSRADVVAKVSWVARSLAM